MLLHAIALALCCVDWASVKTVENVNLLYDKAAWSNPVILPAPVNTLGWEDSVEINWDGSQLIFTYLRLDVGHDLRYQGSPGYVPRLDTPGRPQHPKTPAGAAYASDLYLAKKGTSGWTVDQLSSNINTPLGLEGCASISADGRWLVFRRSWVEAGVSKHACFYSRRVGFGWSTPTLFPPAMNAPMFDTVAVPAADNPFVYQENVFFEIETVTERKNFYSIPFTPWSQTDPPRKKVPDVNSADDETQFFISPDGKQTWFSRNSVVLCRKREGGVVENIVFAPDTAIGEPTIDKFGNLYFIYVFKASENGLDYFDADVLMLRPLK